MVTLSFFRRVPSQVSRVREEESVTISESTTSATGNRVTDRYNRAETEAGKEVDQSIRRTDRATDGRTSSWKLRAES